MSSAPNLFGLVDYGSNLRLRDMAKTLILTHCYPPNGGSFIKHRAKLIDAQVLTMGRPLGFWNFVRFVNDAIGSANKYDIIEAHWLYPAGIAAMIASWITKVPYRVYCHGTDVMMAERSWFWRFWARRVLSRASECRCVSRFLGDKLKFDMGLVDGYPLIDPMEVDKSIFYNRGWRRNGSIFLIKKNIGKYERLRGRFESVFDFNKQNLSQQVMSATFNTKSVVVLASENEGYGLMLAEAAECGCKIIGVDEGGIPEVVAKYGGLLFDGTAEDLKAKIEIALKQETVTV